jgi:pyruvate formate lyase activating enzyme
MLERFCEIGREEGLKYVYIGNVPGHPLEDTYCHGCGKAVIRRRGFAVAKASLVDGRCPGCGTTIPGRFQTRIDPSTGERLPILLP